MPKVEIGSILKISSILIRVSVQYMYSVVLCFILAVPPFY